MRHLPGNAPRPLIALALACMLCLAPAPAIAQDAIGRLFFTPAQRQQMDDARRRPPAPEPVRGGGSIPAPPQAQSLSIDGIVRRSDGDATVWVNRKPTQAPQSTGAVRIGPVRDAAEGADLRLPDNGRRVRIQVGQEVDVQSGRIQERYRQPQPSAVPPAPPEDAAPPPAGATPRSEGARDAAVERILRELGRRLDETPRAPEPAK